MSAQSKTASGSASGAAVADAAATSGDNKSGEDQSQDAEEGELDEDDSARASETLLENLEKAARETIFVNTESDVTGCALQAVSYRRGVGPASRYFLHGSL